MKLYQLQFSSVRIMMLFKQIKFWILCLDPSDLHCYSLFQLSKKNEEASCHLKWLFELIQKRTYPLSGYIDEQITKHGKNLPFVLEEVKASPVVDGYRNRCEFRVGKFQHLISYTVGNYKSCPERVSEKQIF